MSRKDAERERWMQQVYSNLRKEKTPGKARLLHREAKEWMAVHAEDLLKAYEQGADPADLPKMPA